MSGKNLDKHWNESKELLVEAARNAGIDPAIMVKISGFESGFNSHNRPVATTHPENNKVRQFDGTMAISSAYGYGQFLDKTWNEMIHKYGEKYGVPNADKLTQSQTNAPELRDNPRLQAAMLAEFTKENITKGARLGGKDADANVYALHNLGAGDGPKFLSALKDNPNQRVDQVLSAKVISGNPSLYGDGSRSVAEAYKVMGQTMDRYDTYAQQVKGVTPTHKTDTQTPVQKPDTQKPDTQTPASNASIKLNDAYNMGIKYDDVKYGLGSKSLAGGKIDCAGWVKEIQNATMSEINKESGQKIFSDKDKFNTTTSDQMIKATVEKSGVMLTNPISKGMLKEGMIIGEDNGPHNWEPKGRFHGIDHITMVVKNPNTGELMISQSHGGKNSGVDMMPLDNYLKYKQEHGVQLFATDPLAKARPLLEGKEQAPTNPNAGKSETTKPDTPKPETPKPETSAKSPMADGMLKYGEKGPEIVRLQTTLNRLGITGADGKPLKPDGEIGDNTLAAIKRFQHEHGIKDSGIVGPKTLAALANEDKQLLTNPENPNNKLYKEMLGKVNAAEAERKIPNGPHSEKLAAALTVEAIREGITKVDRVELSANGSTARAVQVSPVKDESALNLKTDPISVVQAMKQPVKESSEQAVQVSNNVQAQQQDQSTQKQVAGASR
jgi:peptidoglycan hydrolase-like protein with peptidoglycan-binding domain